MTPRGCCINGYFQLSTYLSLVVRYHFLVERHNLRESFSWNPSTRDLSRPLLECNHPLDGHLSRPTGTEQSNSRLRVFETLKRIKSPPTLLKAILVVGCAVAWIHRIVILTEKFP